ncbi:orotate phosphoribosyltransferase [Exiguobacterium sp. PvP048]|uniref:Orotate phosphoribosyltransferase n=1 Tax=Exiguobacterium sibiricum (strain DSM 17290 / CCUG 55495 / CIP 109462 / JCM 13490 / 255-15) TaxID=262543 RepID=B1YIR5_EXIS2|nr:orotate phosphoribosyltransferase [Exiguobacterium sibiricum]ACB61391.1 orotate phosphoribosyltransferase [Exiguobacterium sibiricum 255-15]MDW2884978.1 orotate phosphoribosyltransferase [Exiguobacterium sibiricum]
MNQLAQALLEIEAVTLAPTAPYTWASGLRSPIYCDNRLTLSSPAVRTLIADKLAERIRPLNADVIAGTATAGIPHAALVAERLGLPMVYIRGSAKGHGKGNQIEGRLQAGQRVIVVEDLLSTGMSSIEATQAVEAAGASVIRIQAIFSYGMTRLKENLTAAGVEADALLTFTELLETAVETAYISKEEQEGLQTWSIDPVKWSESFLIGTKQNS